MGPTSESEESESGSSSSVGFIRVVEGPGGVESVRGRFVPARCVVS